MRKYYTGLILAISIVLNSNAQNKTGNPWAVWYPELGAAGSSVPDQAFAINAASNTIYKTAPNSKSYTIGNDLRGYVYYQNITDGMIHILDPKLSTTGPQTPIGSFSAFQLITGLTGAGQYWVHSIYGFYVSATNKHYIALVGYSDTINSNDLTSTIDALDAVVAIFDVTDPTNVAIVNRIKAGNDVLTRQSTTYPAPANAGNPVSMVPGMVLHQTAYTSAATKIFLVIDDAIKVGSINTLGGGASGPNIRHPGIWIDIVDPLNTTSITSDHVHEVAYDLNNRDYAIYPSPTSAGGSHQIGYDPAHDVVYISAEDNWDGTYGAKNPNKILSFHASAPYDPTYVRYRVNSAAPIGFHGVYVNRAGTALYTGRNSNFYSFVPEGEDRAFKFEISPDGTSTSYIDVEPAASSPSFFDAGGGQYFRNGVKCTNLTPDETYLFSSTYGSESGGGTPMEVATIWSLDPNTLQVVQQVQKPEGGGATFNKIDPHSYAFTLHDFGDAPQSYGTAGHNLVNVNYVEDQLRIGATIDGDIQAQYGSKGDGDDQSASPKTDDEDGITAPMAEALTGLLYGTAGSTYTISNIAVKNTTPNPAVLVGWIDFNHDGAFQATEGTSVPVPINTTSVNLSWTIPADVTAGKIVLRLRISTDASLTVNTPASYVIDGEAEDYVLAVDIAGNVFSDVNANTIFGASGSAGSGENGYNGSVPLYAYLIQNGVILDSAQVKPDGSYAFDNAPQNIGAATIQIGTNSIAPGSASTGIISIADQAPDGWAFTGSSSGATTNGDSGTLSVTVGIGPITDQNFGIQRLPESAVATLPSENNPGGTTSVPLPATAFQTSDDPAANPNTQDYDGGTVEQIRITTFPGDLTSITLTPVGGSPVTYTSASWPAEGVVIDAPNGIQSAPVSIDPVDGSVSPVITFAAIDNAGAEDPTPGTVTVPFQESLMLSGNVFNDTNGLAGTPANTVDGTPIQLASSLPLYANLFSSTGTFIASVPVDSSGVYQFPVDANTSYVVTIGDEPATAASTPESSASLPAGWVQTGENAGTGAGSDGTPDGNIQVAVTDSSVSNVNFGIQRAPESAVTELAPQSNPGGTTNLNIPAAGFLTSDDPSTNPNTQDYDGGTVEALRITEFPNDVTSITLTPQGGSPVTYTSASWPAEGVVIDAPGGSPTAPVSVDPADGAVIPVIRFAAIDNAGTEDPTPGSITLPLTGLFTVSGTVFYDLNGLSAPDSTVNGTPVNGTDIDADSTGSQPVYASLIENGIIVATVPVNADGSYSFDNVPVGSYSVVITSDPSGSTTASLPAGWDFTGDNIGTGPGSDGTPDGALAVNVTTANVTNVNFGINRIPVAQPVEEVIIQPQPGDIITLDGAPGNPPAPEGTDPEEGPLGAGSTVTITVLPQFGILRYNGMAVQANVPIENFQPSLFSIELTGAGYDSTSFEYTYTDAAGATSLPVLYRLSWGAPLPVVLVDFKATTEGTIALLKWSTTFESSSERFDVEHSIDGKNWSQLGSVSSHGESSVLHDYYYEHLNPGPGQNLYRLKMVDKDGSYAYSSIRSVRFGERLQFSVYPNPAKDKVDIKIESFTAGQKVVALELINQSGQSVRKYSNPEDHTLSVAGLPAGIYHVRAKLADGASLLKSIVVQN